MVYSPQNPTSNLSPSPSSRGIDYSTPTTNTFGLTTPSFSPSQQSGSLNVVANSSGGTGFGRTPDLSYANPSTLNRLNINDLIYSAPAGGYLTRSEAENANSYYNKFGSGGGGDPGANQRASAYYSYIGSLPTEARGTPALNQFYAQSGQQPGIGPSYNSMLSGMFSNASPYMQSQYRQFGFGQTYQGPYQFGQQNPNYNMYGAYKGQYPGYGNPYG